MSLSIRAKLFLTLLLACLLVLLGTQGFTHWSFRQGLRELAEAREQARLDQIAERLTDHYARAGSWDALRADPRLWLALLLGRGGDGPPSSSPGPGHLPPWLRRQLAEPGVWPPLPPHARVMPDHPLPLERRVMLLDAAGGILYGRPELLGQARRQPLMLEGATIGFLACLPGPPIPEGAELRFRERQATRLWLSALAMLVLAAALAALLSRRLVRPLREFQAATRQLAAGAFDIRVPADERDEIGRLGRDINAMAAALARNEAARRRWVADIAHELRTPLGLLRAELEALQDGIRPLDGAALAHLHDDVLRLGRLTDDLHELAMTDSGAPSYRFERLDPGALLAADLEAFRARFAAAGLALELLDRRPAPTTIQGDARRLSQLVCNLLQNSLDYTDPGGGLTVTLERIHARDRDWVRIDCADTAPGVPPDALPRLFERLYRVEASRNRRTGGAGLGLAIARNIVAAHGGTIAAQPSAAGGLLIRVELPEDPRA